MITGITSNIELDYKVIESKVRKQGNSKGVLIQVGLSVVLDLDLKSPFKWGEFKVFYRQLNSKDRYEMKVGNNMKLI